MKAMKVESICLFLTNGWLASALIAVGLCGCSTTSPTSFGGDGSSHKQAVVVRGVRDPAVSHADWTPPTHATREEADKIRNEAKADTRAGRYEDSLAKHVWYHQNALTIDPAFRGVRLSFDLGDWVKLGQLYPPALEKLKAIRDEAGQEVREGKGYRQSFIDFAAINERCLNESVKTKDLFVWLDANKPAVAKDVFDVVLGNLVGAKEYRLCGKYLDPDSSYQRILSLYRENDKNIRRSGPLVRMFFGGRRHQQKEFCDYVTTLVAVLVLSERKADADRIAAKAAPELKETEFKEQLEKAKSGELPASWNVLPPPP